MKIGLVFRDLSDGSPWPRWVYALTKAGTRRGDEIHVIAEKLSAGKISAAGGQAHVVEPVRWGGAFGRWVFARRAKKELSVEPLDRVVSAGEVRDCDVLLLLEAPGPGPADAPLRRALAKGRFAKAAVPGEAARETLIRHGRLDPARIVSAGPPATDAPDAEWENRARAFWNAVL